MNEATKIAESEYFLTRGREHFDDAEAVRYNLSAFLSASRSVLQYAREECIAKGVIAWYDAEVQKSVYFNFFKNVRDQNIHKRPIETNTVTKIQAFLPATSTELKFHFKQVDREENVIRESFGDNSEQVEREKAAAKPGSVYRTHDYFFDSWTGQEDAFRLADMYLSDLRQFIQNGVTSGHLTA